ncbi:MAG: O-acetyltransferase OatA [Luteibacter sp.]|uniref:acyltransferase family protein n=1 Tax=Luteibacter sp. TaxID=1886636 RepID=UPI00137D436E|nr:acyltransferase family protein [Luteibacter sp.]KAF1007981.1 MAG: O-acetyltransferase OatA [Luteibacter sp.]
MTPARSPHAYFPYIDGLRAIAVLSVVLYHLHGSWLPGGFAGVDVFFVISGFVVSASVGLRERSSLASFWGYFLARRFQRIAPALLVCLLATTLAATLFIPEAWLSEHNQKTGRFAFFGFSNLVLAGNDNSYFSPITEFNPYTHTWSLGVEEQFYLLFPLLFWAWSFGGRWRRLTLGLFVLLGIASFVHAWDIRSTDSLAAFYLLASRFWELAVGVALYQAMACMGRRFDTSTADPVTRWKGALAILGFVSMGIGFWFSQPEQFPVPGALWAVVGSALILGALHGQPATVWPVRLLTSSPMRLIGGMSYSLYLWHWPVFVLFRWTVGLGDWPWLLAALALTFTLAWLSWRWVEQPVRRSQRIRHLPRWAIVGCGVLTLVIGASLHRFIDHRQPRWSLSTVARHADDWYPTTVRAKTVPPCGVPEPTVEELEHGKRISYARTACEHPVDAPDVFVVGDSHAMAFGTLFEAYVANTGAHVTLYNNSGCAFLSLRPEGATDDRCKTVSAISERDILARVKPGDVVFLPSLRMPRFVDQWIRYPRDAVIAQALDAGRLAKASGAEQQAIDVVSRFSAKGAHVVLEAPNVLLNAPAYRCADWWTRSNPMCTPGIAIDRAVILRLRQPMLDTEQAVAHAVPGTRLFDPLPSLCAEGVECTGFKDGRPLFFDGDHVSGYGNQVLLPAFEEAMRRAVR